jgi:hypothetical protein
VTEPTPDPSVARQARLYKAAVVFAVLTAAAWIGSGTTGSGPARAASMVFGAATVVLGGLWLIRSTRR